MRNTSLYQRVYGCLLGGAVGDAMGFPTEGMGYTTIRRRFGVVDEPLVREGGEKLHPPVTGHVYTDDTVMKHMVCQAILACQGHPTIDAVADVWRKTIIDLDSWVWWLNTRVVASKLRWNKLLDLHEVGRDSIPCNDAAMIVGPIGILNVGDPERAALEAWDISALWQRGYSRECAASMAAAHAEALRSGATVDSVLAVAKRYGPTLAPYVDRALRLGSECADLDEFTARYYAEELHFPNQEYWTPPNHPNPDWCFGADPLEVCTEALAFFVLSRGDARQAILGAINFGRDCDTIAGIAAALCCALHGPEGIPSRWAETILADNPEPDIAAYAEQLSLLIVANSEHLGRQISEIKGLCAEA